MKISNETKIGALTAIAITLLILGFNFLKGKTFFSKNRTIYAKYTNVQGLLPSNPVVINGMNVGAVYSINTDKDMKQIIVALTLTKDVNIPVNSVAIIKPSLLGTTNVEIDLGDAATHLAKNDTILTQASTGIFNDALKKVDPVLAEVTNAVKAIDSVLLTVKNVLDPVAKGNIQAMLANLNKTTASLTISSASLEKLLDTQTGALAKTLDNVSSFTGNLAKNNDKLTDVMSNLDKTTGNLAKLELNRTLDTLNATINSIKASMSQLNTKNGTAGMLLNDKTLYLNFAATANKLNLLLDDLKANPKRYISFSIFGKKNNSNGLSKPLPDTLNAPYLEVK